MGWNSYPLGSKGLAQARSAQDSNGSPKLIALIFPESYPELPVEMCSNPER